jgi:hypothetical protein
MFAVMSLPCVEVGVPIESLVKVIRLNGPGFNPVNVTRMSRNGATTVHLVGASLLAKAAAHPTSSSPDTALSRAGSLPRSIIYIRQSIFGNEAFMTKVR